MPAGAALSRLPTLRLGTQGRRTQRRQPLGSAGIVTILGLATSAKGVPAYL